MTFEPSVSVSVALCTYNGERFLAEQLESILQQDTPVQELVIADDHSSDGTVAVAKHFASTSGLPVRILTSTTNLGVVKNFERAVSSCSGDILLLADQDDIWMPGKVTALTRTLLSSGADAVHSDAALVDADGRDLGITAFEALRMRAAELAALRSGSTFDVLLRRNLMTGATMAITRSLAERALPVGQGWVHDEWFAIIAAATSRTATVEAQLTAYRQHGANEIGMRRSTLRHRIDRVLQARSDRTARLAVRAAVLAMRLEELGADPERVRAATAKSKFERRRAELPHRRTARLPRVLAMAARGEYPRYASQGWWDVARDVLQSASPK